MSFAANSSRVAGQQAVDAVADVEPGRGARRGQHRQPVGERLDELQRRASALQQRHDGAAGGPVGGAQVVDEAGGVHARVLARRLLEPCADERQERIRQLLPHPREDLVEQEAQPVAVGLVGEVGDEDRAPLGRAAGRPA